MIALAAVIPEASPGKTCKNCGIPQPLANFSKRYRGKLGLAARCKSCERLRERDRPRRKWKPLSRGERTARLKARNDGSYEREMEEQRARAANRRTNLKLVGGSAYEEHLEKGRVSSQKRYANLTEQERQRLLVRIAVKRAQKKGMTATITWEDIDWVGVCPVFGTPLVYGGSRDLQKAINSATASLDRWDNSKGYVPGNVYVISYRANILKRDASVGELVALARYAQYGVDAPPQGLEDVW